jgi:hypothetical protein
MDVTRITLPSLLPRRVSPPGVFYAPASLPRRPDARRPLYDRSPGSSSFVRRRLFGVKFSRLGKQLVLGHVLFIDDDGADDTLGNCEMVLF